jgi:multiple sugar transport system permease protein
MTDSHTSDASKGRPPHAVKTRRARRPARRPAQKPIDRLGRRRVIQGLLFVSPWLIGFLVFTAYPVVASLYYSLTDYRVLRPPHWVGLSNYTTLLTGDEYFWRYAVYNTAYMFLELPASVALGVGLALLLNQKVRGMGFYRTLFYLPSVVPTVAASMLWLWVLNPQYGLANVMLQRFHLSPLGWLTDPRWSKPSFILMDLWGAGGGMVIYLAALQGVPEQLYEAALLDGAGAWRRFWHVTLPMISPVVFFNVILGVIGTFQYFTQTYIMTQGGPELSTTFYALYLFQNAFEYFRMGYACAMAWVLFLITLGATLVVFRSSARWVYYESGEAG